MNRFRPIFIAIIIASSSFERTNAQGQLVKVELKHNRAAGHVRSDPIINQNCASGHVHTFYGPKYLHPATTYSDLLNAPPSLSTSQVEENQSLYWHPTFYVLSDVGVYKRVSNTEATAYYRWDKGLTTKAFPPGFRMISASTDQGADQGGPTGGNLYTECCNFPANEELPLECEAYDTGADIYWPPRKCDFLDVVFAMPTCWDGSQLGDTNNHKDHMRFTEDGTVFGDCPSGFETRLPQIQLFVKIPNYNGVDKTYTISDGSSNFHIDFFNGWKEEKLQEVIDNCEVLDPNQPEGEINPEVGCTPSMGDFRFLTESDVLESGSVCDIDIRHLIIDEATDLVSSLPSGSCTGKLIEKSWSQLTPDILFGECNFNEPCKQKTKDKFYYEKKGVVKEKKCKWLKKQKEKGKKLWKNQVCRQEIDSDKPAYTVCPKTCETCGLSI